ERGLAASSEVADATYLFPYIVTGTRALLRAGDVMAAGDWLARAGEPVLRRGIPGTLPALAHAQGLIDLAKGLLPAARQHLTEASAGWQARQRFWEGSFAKLDLARALQRSSRAGEATALIGSVRSAAQAVGATPLIAAADALGGSERRPWHPLSARE